MKYTDTSNETHTHMQTNIIELVVISFLKRSQRRCYSIIIIIHVLKQYFVESFMITPFIKITIMYNTQGHRTMQSALGGGAKNPKVGN